MAKAETEAEAGSFDGILAEEADVAVAEVEAVTKTRAKHGAGTGATRFSVEAGMPSALPTSSTETGGVMVAGARALELAGPITGAEAGAGAGTGT